MCGGQPCNTAAHFAPCPTQAFPAKLWERVIYKEKCMQWDFIL
jgi:hypothetical protein